MNKKDLIKYISDKTLITKKDTAIILDVTINGIIKGLEEDKKVKIRDFGSFFIQERKSRIAMNPKTHEQIEVPAKNVVKFKTSNKINERM